MRKSALGLVILLAVTVPAMAAQMKGKSAKAEPANPNENGIRLMRDAIPLFLPTVALPFYLKMKGDGDKTAKGGKGGKSRKRKK